MTSYIQAVEEQQDKDRLWKMEVRELLEDIRGTFIRGFKDTPFRARLLDRIDKVLNK